MIFSESLKKNRDFQNVYRKRTSQANKFLVMYLCKNSVVRHHLTRLLRESYRLNEEKFQKGYDLVVVVRPQARECGFREMESALLHLAKIHGIRTDIEEKKEER